MSEVTKNIGAFAPVGAFTYSAPYYSQFVIPFVMHAGSDLSAAVTGGSGTATSVDNLWNMLSVTLNDFKNNELDTLEWYSFTDQLYIYLIWGWICWRAAAYLLHHCISNPINIHGWHSLLSAGILFICFSLFASTRNMFSAWVGSCLNYILLNLFIVYRSASSSAL